MPDLTTIEFNRADNRQRKAVRVALVEVFRSAKSLEMFLDEDLGLDLSEIVEDGPFKAQVYELVKYLASRGKLDELMRKLSTSSEYKEAPALHDLLIAWPSVSAPSRRPVAGAKGAGAEKSLERILDGEVARMRPMTMLTGIAALRRRVCLLRSKQGKPVGTGFLIGPNLVLTAAYIPHLGDRPASLEAEFDFGIEERKTEAGSALWLGAPTVIDPADAPKGSDGYTGSLDYAVLPLRKRIGEQPLRDGSARGWFDMTDTRERLREGEPLFLLHHPAGGPMNISIGAVGPPNESSDRIPHSCSTIAGSGGAPLLDATLRLVGVHEMGKRSNAFNTAVRADRIARDLAKRGIKITAPPAREA